MKHLIKTLPVALLVTVIIACTLEEIPDSTTQGTIVITAQTLQESVGTNVPDTKTILSGVETHWVAGTDKIGIFSPQARTTDGGDTPVNNAEFTARTSAKNSGFSGTMFWGSEDAHHFYAYYPYNSAYEGDQTTVPISLPPAQTQSAAGNTDHIGALDYMVATPLTVARGGAVSLTFNHVFAMIEFQITGSGNLTQINLVGADPLACSGTIDLSQTPSTNTYAITTASTSNDISLTLNESVTLSETAASIYMMVLPGLQTQSMQIAIKTDGTWKVMDKDALMVEEPFTRGHADRGFLRGQKYVVSLDSESEGWSPAFEDIRDGNIYQYVTIGDQVWMAENLAYLPGVVGPATGSEDTGLGASAFYYVYGYDGTSVAAAKATSNYAAYGALYNWTAALSACPDGWHLPSDAEWTQLETYLANNGYNYDGSTGPVSGSGVRDKIAKSLASEIGWSTSDVEGSPGNTEDYVEYINKSGFTALPGGMRYSDGLFYNIGNDGFWWSTTESSSNIVWYRLLRYNYSNVSRYQNEKANGLSVRCLRD